MTTIEAYAKILASDVFRLDGEAIDLPQALLDLGNAIKEEGGGTDWHMGEMSAAPLDSVVIGGYWCLIEWHAGQSSVEYQALSVLSQVYKPGPCCKGPQKESTEMDAFEAFNAWFEKKYGQVIIHKEPADDCPRETQ